MSSKTLIKLDLVYVKYVTFMDNIRFRLFFMWVNNGNQSQRLKRTY